MTALDRHPASVITIDGEPFFLAKEEKDGSPKWFPQAIQTQEGDPRVPRMWTWRDWSRGMGDSRGMFKGSVEYAENAFLGHLGRILPGPKVTEITTGNGADIVALVDVSAPARRLIAFGGTTAKELDNTLAVATTSASLGVNVTDAVLFVDQVAIALGDSADFYRRSAAGAYSANSISYKARAFGISDGDLVRGYAATWSKCSESDFYSNAGNWSDEYPIGDRSKVVTRVFGHDRWDYVIKEEGLYTFDIETSDEANVLGDLRHFPSLNNRGWFSWNDLLFLCTIGGLYRFVSQGVARPVGIEEIDTNESVLLNARPTAGISFGKWAYVAYYLDGTDTTYICMVRRAQDGDTGMGSPFTVTSVIDKFTGKCLAMSSSDITGDLRCYYGAGAKLRYFKVGPDGIPREHRDSGSMVIRFAPTDLGAPLTVKYFRGIDAIVRNLSATRTLQWGASRDNGADANVGSALATTGAEVRTEAFWTAATNDSGRVIQLVATVGLDGDAVAEIREVVLNFEERPEMTDGAMCVLRFRDHDAEAGYVSRMTAEEARAFIDERLEGRPLIVDAEGKEYRAAIQRYEGDTAYAYRGERLQSEQAFIFRRLDYS